MCTEIKPDYILVKKCNFTKMCSCRSLPKQSGVVPLCNSSHHDSLDIMCSNFIFHLLEKNQQGHCKKACSVKEFQVKDETDQKFDCLDRHNRFEINYMFGLPDSSKDLRSKRPFKTVHEEYYILDERGVIGTIGGTISLFTGYSFFGIATWIFVNLKWIIVKMASKNHHTS